MADKMMRVAGRGADGKAKAIKTDGDGNLTTISAGSKLLIDDEVTVTLDGFHVFGGTVGRSHQRILDISRYKSLSITVESPVNSLANPGGMHLLFFNEHTRYTTGANPLMDGGIMYQYNVNAETGKNVTKGSKMIFNSYNYSFLDVSSFMGMVVMFESMPKDANVKVKVIGGL